MKNPTKVGFFALNPNSVLHTALGTLPVVVKVVEFRDPVSDVVDVKDTFKFADVLEGFEDHHRWRQRLIIDPVSKVKW